MSMCMLRPSILGWLSMTATSFRSSARRSRMVRPCSGCAISRPRNMMVIFTLLPASKKRSTCFFLGGVVAHVDFRTELHFCLDLRLVLRACLALMAWSYLNPAAVHDAAHRRRGVGSDLDEIEPFVIRDALGLRRRVDAQLLAVEVDQAALAHRDLVVEPRLLSSYCAHLPSLRLAAANKPAASAAVLKDRLSPSDSRIRATHQQPKR